MALEPISDPPDGPEEELSLDRLSEAFAEVLGRAGEAPQPRDEREPASTAAPAPQYDAAAVTVAVADAGPPNGEDVPIDTASVLEALLFVGHPRNEPLTAQQAVQSMRGVAPSDVHDAVGALNRRYATRGCPYHVVSDGPGYRLELRPEFFSLRDKFYGRVRAARLSQAAIEVLSLVAYGQPQTREAIDAARGVSSAAVLSQLVRRRLLRIERSEPLEGRPRQTLYYTTRRLLSLLGLDSLEDLPQALDVDRR